MLKEEKFDSLLAPLLLTTSEEEAGMVLSQIITAHATPVIKSVIRYRLHLWSHRAAARADADDLCQEAILQLLAEMRRSREQPHSRPIMDLRGLAAVIAHRTCSRWMRRKFPERHALKNRLRYLLSRQNGFALWQGANKKLMAGFAAWQAKTRGAAREQLMRLLDDEAFVAQIRLLTTDRGRAELADTLAAIFNRVGGPIEFDSLVGALADLLSVPDQPIESNDPNEAELSLAIAGERDTAWQVEKRIFLQRLWQELRRLPLVQRAALLLNLRSTEGVSCIALFPATGVATLRELAEVLNMTAEEFAELWKELPLEDARIAELLRLTRQQVINARKSGRERLARQLKGFI